MFERRYSGNRRTLVVVRGGARAEEVEPGVTYRNVEVGWAARARGMMPEQESLEEEEDDQGRED